MTTKAMYEIFEEIENAKNKEQRLSILRQNATWALRSTLKGAFDPNVKFVFEKMPDYTPSLDPPGLSHTSLHQELTRAYLFQVDNPRVSPSLTLKRKIEILIQMLETLEAKEAKVLEGILTKKLKVKGLSYALVKEAFPDLLP